MARTSLESKVIAIIAEQLSLREGDVTLESRFVDDLGADSLDIVELVMEIEEEFGVEIPDEDIENITCVKDAVKQISRLTLED